MSGPRFSILHRPDRDLIRVRIWEGGELMADSGDLLDTHTGSLKGGRLGVYCDSQEGITWSALSYRSVIIIWCESYAGISVFRCA